MRQAKNGCYFKKSGRDPAIGTNTELSLTEIEPRYILEEQRTEYEVQDIEVRV